MSPVSGLRLRPLPGAAAAPDAGRATQRPQMADVARLAGVSVSTVSRALGGRHWVHPATRARIEAVAQALHYQVDVAARSLRLGCNGTVSVVVPGGREAVASLTDPFCLALIGSLADALTAAGHDMLLSRPPAGDTDALARDFTTGRACGLIVIGQGRHHAQLEALAARGIPLVVWGARLQCQRYLSVGSDHHASGRMAAEHLLDQGARQLAFVGDLAQPESALRHAGCVQALAARGLPPPLDGPALEAATRAAAGSAGEADDRVPHAPDDSQASLAARIDAWLAQTPQLDGVVCASDPLAMAVLQGLHRQGRAVPQRVRVVGHGDSALAAHLRPALSSVAQPVRDAGPALVQALRALLGAGPRPASVLLPTRLEVRASSLAGWQPPGWAQG